MPVGKGSLLRASKLQEDTEGKKEKAVEEKVTPAVVTASVITSGDDIHEKKFEAISKITCDLPDYLL